MGQKIRKFIEIGMIIAMTCIVGILCFYHLGEAGTHNTDEARHIANAYEMFKKSEIWIHTYKYETDYFNYKPPLSMWCIMLCFRLFGISSFSMRLYSAVAWMLLYLIFTVFLWKKWGWSLAMIFSLAFVSGPDLFLFHGARSADADALYLLLYTCAIICLYLAEEKPHYLIPFGFLASLCFLTKCLHVATLIVIFICYLPRLYKRIKLKHWLGGIAAGVIPTGIWAGVRFSFDGFAFFAGMLGREVVDRVEESSNYLGYLFYLLKQPVCVIAIAAICVSCFFSVEFPKRKNVDIRKIGEAAGDREICRLCRKIVNGQGYLFFLWFLVPFVIYSLSGAFMEWYSYSCFLALYALAAVEITKPGKGKKGRFSEFLFIGCFLICACIQVKESVNILKYTNNTGFRADLERLIEQNPEYRGSSIYLENNTQEYKPQNEWEQNRVADAYITGDLQPLDGGVPLFLKDQDALLIISKNLFEGYYDVLAGRVILVDGEDYLIFSNKFY